LLVHTLLLLAVIIQEEANKVQTEMSTVKSVLCIHVDPFCPHFHHIDDIRSPSNCRMYWVVRKVRADVKIETQKI